MSPGRSYHHGDLRAALIEASFEVLAENGLRRFSVAAVARRLQVSSAAPYRHFPDRDHLLSAVSAAAARDLRDAIGSAADAAGPDPADRLAAAAGAYVRYVTRTGAGFHVIFATELYEVADDARREQTRALMSTLLDLAAATHTGSHEDVMLLVEATIAVAHGYTSLFADGFFARNARTADDIANRAVEAAHALTTD
ncbi:AcrR family transcriptional regulator [Actinoplanes lutulentus]|uniref:TetR family transcriptional regulator n=1 Tax=Actinoplanes lutulentus TaxID=1287878 RepID=A0A327ZJM2_9ACTN|nr:TetR/AcrR family transcriptional regulator [Actinoplanes lutulentus]MBB2940721.1 AcrR family transcriptional regulator [Actinoplanes lutulentus]RAK43032.1 TetR family transcriptional regulator [Actinoplanes lutulentus]